jgi:peptidoglycan/xylan/chitin deacetylase (PgdA/CDA1 family)
MSGSFVISLDFELMWGVRDHRCVENYGDAVLGGREAIVHILSRFQEANIKSTWATVGLLFAKNRDEMLEFAPSCRPAYENTNLSPYTDIENSLIGESEKTDPFHFGASLIERIANTPGQEIATHTYSHYYCMEPGATVESFVADLTSARAIAAKSGHNLQTIIFPRNQTTLNHVQHAAEIGVDVYRGEAKGWLYRPRSANDTTPMFRLARFIDSALPLGPKQVLNSSLVGRATNVPASRFLRPWSKRLGPYNDLHIHRILSEMKAAAQTGGVYHLWWHPHNFGRNTAKNLDNLKRILNAFVLLQDEFGMQSLNMSDIAQRAQIDVSL